MTGLVPTLTSFSHWIYQVKFCWALSRAVSLSSLDNRQHSDGAGLCKEFSQEEHSATNWSLVPSQILTNVSFPFLRKVAGQKLVLLWHCEVVQKHKLEVKFCFPSIYFTFPRKQQLKSPPIRLPFVSRCIRISALNLHSFSLVHCASYSRDVSTFCGLFCLQ